MTSVALSLGRAAEVHIGEDLERAGWLVRTSPKLDHASKVDIHTVCLGRRPFDLQISVSPKSNNQRDALEARGVHPLSVAELDRKGVTAAEFVCEQLCTRVLCSFSQIPVQESLMPKTGLPIRETPVSICT